jgi:HEAT repeat protein
MLPFLRNFRLDRFSFWLGFLAGSLIWWLLGIIRPQIPLLLKAIKARSQAARRELQAGTEVHHRNDTLILAQHQHLAAPLFSLDEILIVPRLLAPPPPVEPNVPPPPADITEHVFPYLPDWPELASVYNAPTLTLAEALAGGVNIALMGPPGSGKTVALAHTASMVARHDQRAGSLKELVPLFLQSAELTLPEDDSADPLESIVSAVALHASKLTLPRLSNFITTVFESGRALVLLDGMDEFPHETIARIVDFLRTLLEKYPQTRFVVAVSPGDYDGLLSLGFAPLSLAAWTENQRAAFIRQWSARWKRYIARLTPEESTAPEPALLNGWLLNDATPLTPLELTLKIWAVYAGDLIGPDALSAIKAYLQRMTVDVPTAIPAMERLALQMAYTLRVVVPRKEAENWVDEFELQALDSSQTPKTENDQSPTEPIYQKASSQESISVPRVLSALLENGLLRSMPNAQITFIHSVFAGYLAAVTLSQQGGEAALLSQPDWALKNLSMQFLSIMDPAQSWIPDTLQDSSVDLLLRGLFKAARWLRYTSDRALWGSTVLRRLSNSINDEKLDDSLKVRAMVALATSGSSGVNVLFRQLLSAKTPNLRQIGALGCGILRDAKSVNELCELLGEHSPNVRRAACLALANIGDQPSLDALASALLHGDSDLRQYTAEALVNHPEEGHPILSEGATLEDLMIRRAVVDGLKRVKEAWATQILEKMQVEDSQWVVKNAASQALEELNQPDPRVPRPFPALTETPWLIAFAGEQGMGVVPGKPAMDMLLLALKQGNAEQRLAAMRFLLRYGGEEAVLPLYNTYFSSQGEVRVAALSSLWHLAAAGLEMPSAMQFGLN